MNKPYQLILGDCVEAMNAMEENSVDSVVTDPPYGIRFMGMAWDGKDIEEKTANRASYSQDPDKRAGANGDHKSVAAEAGKYDRSPSANKQFEEWSRVWAEAAFRVLKPGGHLLSFASTRTYHRMASGIEDAGFEIRDQIMWIFGSGFPKSKNVALSIDKKEGFANRGHRVAHASRFHPDGTFEPNGELLAPYEGKTTMSAPWQGWGTALKPAHEPIVVARKPLVGTVAANVLQYGTGAINIDECRVGTDPIPSNQLEEWSGFGQIKRPAYTQTMNVGRWPANLIHDGSEEVLAAFPNASGQQGDLEDTGRVRLSKGIFGDMAAPRPHAARIETETSAARFFMRCKESDEEWIWRNLKIENANTANSNFLLSSIHVVSALVAVVNAALPEGMCCSTLNFQRPTMNVTAKQLKQITIDVTEKIRILGLRFSPERPLGNSIEYRTRAKHAGAQKQIDTTKITHDLLTSGGFVVNVTLIGTLIFSELGEKDSEDQIKRLIYCPKASRTDRNEGCYEIEPQRLSHDGRATLIDNAYQRNSSSSNFHPTVKPTSLMRYLVRLVTPPNGRVLDPFMGSGSTGKAALLEGFQFTGIEMSADYMKIAERRLSHAFDPDEIESVQKMNATTSTSHLSLFDQTQE